MMGLVPLKLIKGNMRELVSQGVPWEPPPLLLLSARALRKSHVSNTVCKPRRALSPETASVSALILDFPTSRL